MKRVSIIFVLLLAVSLAAIGQQNNDSQTKLVVPAEPPSIVEIPRPPRAKWQEFKTDVGKIISLSTRDGELARWELVDDDYADLVGSSTRNSDKSISVSFTASRVGNYRILAYTQDKPTARILVIVGNPPTGPPGVDPPPVDPPVGQGVYYFILVRPDGPATPEFTKIVSYPAWEELKKAGHLVKDYSKTDAVTKGFIKNDATVPCVVVIKVVDGKTIFVNPFVPLPTTNQGVLDLQKEIK